MSKLLTVVFIALALIVFGTGQTHAAVLLWETKKTEVNKSFGLLKLTKEEFQKYIEEKYSSTQPSPLLAVFVEETLSIEDFSWKNFKGIGNFPNLKNLTDSAKNVEFITKVENPMYGIKQLKESGHPSYDISGDAKLEQEFSCGDVVIVRMPEKPKHRTNVLREHDMKMKEIFTTLSSKCEHTIGLLMGLKAPHVGRNHKYGVRQVAASRAPGFIIYQDSRGVGLMITKFFPNLTYKGESTLLGQNSTSPFMVIGNFEDCSHILMYINFKDNYTLKANFDNLTVGYWYLRTIDVLVPDKNGTLIPFTLEPAEDVYAPLGYSFSIGYPLVFKDRKDTLLTFGNLQVEPFFRNPGSKAFGEAVYAVPFFTPGILSGLFVMFVLGTIFTWGVTMMMDIRTMSRFDDPAGKGLVISSSDKD